MNPLEKKLTAEEAAEQALDQAEYAYRGGSPEQEEFTGTAYAFYKELIVGGAMKDEPLTRDEFMNRAIEEYVAVFVEARFQPQNSDCEALTAAQSKK